MILNRLLKILIYSVIMWILLIPIFDLIKGDVSLAHIFTSLILGSFFGILNEILNKIK